MYVNFTRKVSDSFSRAIPGVFIGSFETTCMCPYRTKQCYCRIQRVCYLKISNNLLSVRHVNCATYLQQQLKHVLF